MKVNEVNGKDVGMVNGRNWQVRKLSRNEFWKNISCFVLAPTFDIGGSRLWDK